jgi:hypothetical protein
VGADVGKDVHPGGVDRPRLVQYVLVDRGMDLSTVRRVPQLHLARLWVEDGWKIHGAKVVNRTLGDCEKVCGRLLDAALSDVTDMAQAEAWATMHGVSDLVLRHMKTSSGEGTRTTTRLLQAIAMNEANSMEGRDAWEEQCVNFIDNGLSGEANLYTNAGGTFSRIEHNADRTEYADTCSGSMAVFRFS